MNFLISFMKNWLHVLIHLVVYTKVVFSILRTELKLKKNKLYIYLKINESIYTIQHMATMTGLTLLCFLVHQNYFRTASSSH